MLSGCKVFRFVRFREVRPPSIDLGATKKSQAFDEKETRYLQVVWATAPQAAVRSNFPKAASSD